MGEILMKYYKYINDEKGLMGKMELAKSIAGCAAALTTETGHISYLGPLTNAETRRFVAAVPFRGIRVDPRSRAGALRG